MLKKYLPQIFALLFFAAFAVYAWTEPSQAPPNGNVAAPVNVSATTQYKSGALGIGGVLDVSALRMTIGAGTGKVLTSDASGLAAWTASPQPGSLVGWGRSVTNCTIPWPVYSDWSCTQFLGYFGLGNPIINVNNSLITGASEVYRWEYCGGGGICQGKSLASWGRCPSGSTFKADFVPSGGLLVILDHFCIAQ